MRKPLAVIVVVLALCLSGTAPAHAADPSLDAQVERILTDFPGGVRTSENTIEWKGGAVVLTLASPNQIAPLSVGSCATGSYCAYTGVSLSGSKLSFTTCPATVSTAALPGVVRSVANARSSGTVRPLNASGTVLATIAAGGQVNSAPTGITQLRCAT